MKFDNPENILLMTSEWKGDRFPDGRPRVQDEILERLRKIKTEEAWSPFWKAGYKFQFEGNFKTTNADPNYILVGRALTAVMVPSRPDVHMALLNEGWEQGRHGFFNQWTIESLQENDVLVVDMFDKIVNGTYVGGNLSTSIKSKTKNGGAVIWGGIRDLQQIVEIPDYQVYYRGIDPTPIGDVMLSGINVPCRIGNAICIPGDVVLGTMSGVLFIPPHLAEAAAIVGEKQQIKDLFGFERLKEGVYTSAEIDALIWSNEVMEDFVHWMETSPLAEPYQHLTWSEEIEKSKDIKPMQFTGLS